MINLKLKKTTILLYTICLLTIANGSGLGVFGGSIFLDESADSIQLIKEKVHIHLKDTLSHVSCKFWIHNYGEAKNIFVGFPDWYFQIPIVTSPVSNFTCKINGEKVTRITTVSLKEAHVGAPERAIASRQWFRWEMSIGKNDTVLIENEYDGNWRNYLCQNSFYFIIGNGATWDGPVVEGRVTFDHSDLFSTNVLIKDTVNTGKLRPEYFDDSVVYTFSNYFPGRKEKVAIRAFQITWPPIDDSRSNHCPYRDVKTSETAKNLKNELYALHGYPFKDPVLSKYYNARKWYTMDCAFDSTKFSPGDIGFLKNLDRIEAGLKIKM